MKKALKLIISLILVAVLLGGAAWYFLLYNPALTTDLLLDWGAGAQSRGHTNTAIRYYRWAYQLSGQDPELAIQLAKAYQQADNYTKAEYTLANAIAAGGSLDVYLTLCQIYVEQDKLLDAVTMLDQIADPAVKAQLDAMRPAAPTANLTPGFYNQYMEVTLDSGGGDLYVSTNGEYPSTRTDSYSDSIALGLGETTICALSVSEQGLVSPLSVFGYTISGVVEDVTLSDPALDAYVRELLSRSAGSTLTTADLWGITELTLPAEVAEISDLSYFTGLTSLVIQDRPALSLSFLSGMTQLQTLDLSGCTLQAEELELIGALPQLQVLNLSGCGLSTIAGLSRSATLLEADLSDNSISDIAPLAENSGLSTLNLQRNAVTDLTPLSGFTELSWLDASYNSVQSISPLGTCVKLSYLNLTNNNLTDLSSIGHLTSLAELDASYNALTDISGLESCVDLGKLNLSNNSLESMDSLASLTQLTDLDISYNDIQTIPDFPDDSALVTFNGCHNFFEDVSGLAGLQSLNYVYLDYNNIFDINCLSTCTNLIQVNVFKTNVTDVSKLLDMSVIVSYNPT